MVAAVVGCGPGKEMPEDITLPPAASGTLADPLGPVPPSSDPAAAAVVRRAVNAITDNAPDRLAKARVSRCVVRGSMLITNFTDTNRRLEAIWPNRAQVKFLFGKQATLRYNGRVGWIISDGQKDDTKNPVEMARILHADVTAQHWLPLGLPFADPQTVVFEPKPSADPAGTTVKVALPEMAVYSVLFDEKTGLPVRIEYHPIEGGVRPHKQGSFSDHKPAGGLLLPTKMEFKQNGQVTERWTVESWEFPETLDDSLFEEPK
jgi:hypothetical protein